MFGTIFTGSAETACETYTDHTDIVTELVKGSAYAYSCE
jgi:hypothetical protein